MTDGVYDESGAFETGTSPDTDGDHYAAGQKYILLEVPDYDYQQESAVHPRSFVQLGAYPKDAVANPKKWGEDLLDLAGVPTSAAPYFKDDYRKQHGQQHDSISYYRDDGTGSSTWDSGGHDPNVLTGELRTRGGWRQHTDGNHISTVRGDRVDVIFGNYKLAVLGRMDLKDHAPPWGETYWESSGGHSRMATNTQGDRVMVEWSPRAGAGCWRVYDETIKGDSITRYQGIVEEINELRTKESYVGHVTDTAPDILDLLGLTSPEPDPVIPVSSASDAGGAHTQTDQTDGWINPSTGPGSGRPRQQANPDVTETTEAGDIDSTTKVTDGMGATGADKLDLDSGNVRARTFVEHLKSDKTLGIGATLRSDTTCDAGATFMSQTGIGPELSGSGGKLAGGDSGAPIGLYVNTSAVVGKFGLELYGMKTSRTYGAWTFNLKLVAVTIDVGVRVESIALPNFLSLDAATLFDPTSGKDMYRHSATINVGATAEFSAKALDFVLNVGPQITFKLVETLDNSSGPDHKYYLLNMAIKGISAKIKAARAKTAATDNSATVNAKTN